MGGGPVNAFEQKVVQHLLAALPSGYSLLPNFALRDQQGRAYEYDVVVFAPHALYVIEAKEWYGRLAGDDTEWLLNGKPRKCPLWLAEQKAKVLKARTGMTYGLWVEPLLVVPDGISSDLAGNWARALVPLSKLAGVLQDPQNVAHPAKAPLPNGDLRKSLLGHWQARRAQGAKRFGSYEVVETVAQDAESGEYLARLAIMGGEERFRVRTWHLDPYLSADDRKRRENVIRRPAEALAKLGRHPNLLPILAFDFDADTNDFYEVTEWSTFGTLHGYLRHSDRQQQLTLRERIEIAAGVASALEAVHARGLVHRNVSPETILVGFDRQPRLTDFDRAYIDLSQTVFPQTTHRRRNVAYVPPELADVSSYDFESGSDMYSFGVLLFELLTNEVPFDAPAAAVKAHGVPSALPSQLRVGLSSALDDLIKELLVVEDFRARPTAGDALRVLRKALGGSSAARSSDGQGVESATPEKPPSLGPGVVVNANIRIDAELGHGAFSRVFKVWHFTQEQAFAMKVLTRPEDSEVLLGEFNKIGRALPQHPNIARMIWLDRLPAPYDALYMLTEYVDGETLEAYCDGRKQLAWSEIRNISAKLLDALSALHGNPERYEARVQELSGRSLTDEEYDELLRLRAESDTAFVHRDIKPANVMLALPAGEPKLIDFNIASRISSASGLAGTPRYWAPDRGQPQWRPDHDLFSLGVVIYEMVTHRHPFRDDRPTFSVPFDPREVCPDLHLSDDLAEFLLKAVQPAGPDRFQSATAMKAALLAISGMHAPIEQQSEIHQEEGQLGITLEPWEVNKPNYNPYVTRLLTLYSQAKRTNSGTRGLDEIARFTYVPTRLDTHLTPAIADGKFRLVVVTGNAGDGKTAFLQRVEQYFRNDLGVGVTGLANANGSSWTHKGLSFETNYDGSQDEGDVESDTVLERFFSPFAGDTKVGLTGKQVRLIAINEGRLLDFLDHSAGREQFAGLREQLKRALAGQVPPSHLLVVNLNLRAVAAGGRESLVEQQLQQLLRDEIWAPCDGCAFRTRCPLRHNADSMRDAASGRAVRERVRRLFEVVHLRRRAHVTMRDLRSALSWLLVRDTSCDDVAALFARIDQKPAETRNTLVHLAYPAAYMADDGLKRQTLDDRLVRLLREADVGLVDEPRLDRRLDAAPESAVPWMAFDDRATYHRELLSAWSDAAPQSIEDASPAEVLAARRRVVGMWRRWAYFERRDGGWEEMLPYRSLDLLERVLQARTDTDRQKAGLVVRDRVIEAISLSEGLRHPSVRSRYLALRVSRIKDPTVRSYRLFPREDFEVLVGGGGRMAEFLESAPDAVELRPVAHRGVASLRIPLDLLEMLELIRRGYRPSPADLQGLFVNLVIFRNELLNLPFEKVLLTPDNETLYELAGTTTPQGAIHLDLSRVDDSALAGLASETHP